MTISFLVDAVLFDMDGTLIDSTPGVVSAWNKFAETYSFDVSTVLRESHGVRLVDSLRKWCGINNPDLLQKECARFEELVIEGGPVALPGVQSLLTQLDDKPPNIERKWTIVTSATTFFASLALQRVSIVMPPSVVTSEHVSRGKPFPDPYLEGARRCNVKPENSLVIEDAPSGIQSGRAAGAKTLAVCTSHSRKQLLESGVNPDCIVEDLTSVSAKWIDGKIAITIAGDATSEPRTPIL